MENTMDWMSKSWKEKLCFVGFKCNEWTVDKIFVYICLFEIIFDWLLTENEQWIKFSMSFRLHKVCINNLCRISHLSIFNWQRKEY